MRIYTLTDVRFVESAVVRVATIISINKATQAGLERNPGTRGRAVARQRTDPGGPADLEVPHI
jgi:hypothetical protein